MEIRNRLAIKSIPVALSQELRESARNNGDMDLGCAGASGVFVSVLVAFMCIVMAPHTVYASGPIPGEDQSGLFHALAHLHPATYVVLFLIVMLAAANLVFQYGLWVFVSPRSFLTSLFRGRRGDDEPRPLLRRLRGSGFEKAKERKGERKGISRARHESRVDGVVSVRQVSRVSPGVSESPTPLDGVDHQMPSFSAPGSMESGAPRVVQASAEKKPPTEFKFSSVVDVPSREEIERRERSQLSVSGSVTGSDGKGMSSVIVYLTDGEGNRVGQSCRSSAETGEFRVLTNEPGRYILKGYKRGFVMERTEALVLPIESGRIDGYNFRMIPEGCAIMGRVLTEGTAGGVSDYEVRCTCKTLEGARCARTSPSGEFRIHGVPMNTECLLEVYGRDGNLVTRSAPFQTVQKKEAYVDIRLPSRDKASPALPHSSDKPGPEASQADLSAPQGDNQ